MLGVTCEKMNDIEEFWNLLEKREQLKGKEITGISFNLAISQYAVDRNYEELSAAVHLCLVLAVQEFRPSLLFLRSSSKLV